MEVSKLFEEIKPVQVWSGVRLAVSIRTGDFYSQVSPIKIGSKNVEADEVLHSAC